MKIKTAQNIMAIGAVTAFLLAVSLVRDGNMGSGILNFGTSLFFLFNYYNPKLLMISRPSALDDLLPNATDKKLLWTSLAIGALGGIWGLTSIF